MDKKRARARAVLWGVLCEQVAALGVPAEAVGTVADAFEAGARESIDRWVGRLRA